MKQETIERIRKFTSDRDWNKYHTPNALAKTIAIESTELLECFQWNENYNIEKVKEELADVLSYCYLMADHYHLDVDEILNKKLDQNEAKYPADKVRGSSKKYNEYKK